MATEEIIEPQPQAQPQVPNGYEEKTPSKFVFRSETGALTAVPKTGTVNVIQLEQEDRTDWLITRLPRELALKYFTAKVENRHGEARGDKCIIVTKYRGEGIDVDHPERSGEIYTLLFTPYYAERNADLTKIDEGISDSDIKDALLALDESKGLEYRNKWLVEREMRTKEKDYNDQKTYDFRSAVTRSATTVVDDVALGESAIERDISLFSMDRITRWLHKHWFWLIVTVITVIIIATMFR